MPIPSLRSGARGGRTLCLTHPSRDGVSALIAETPSCIFEIARQESCTRTAAESEHLAFPCAEGMTGGMLARLRICPGSLCRAVNGLRVAGVEAYQNGPFGDRLCIGAAGQRWVSRAGSCGRAMGFLAVSP